MVNYTIRYIYVRMELKRNPGGLGPSPQQKQSSMMQPFINISKASTPVRTRLVAPPAQPSPSPISINKVVAGIHKSPNNKENHHGNHHRPEGEGSLFRSGKQFDADNRINLSPILSLNRKLTEGPRFQPKKSLTPEGHKVIADYEGYGPDKRSTFENNFNSLGSMNDSKGSSNYSSASNLRGSNCFKALIDNRAKSPNRFDGSSGSKMLNKRESTPLLKESVSSSKVTRTLAGEVTRNLGGETKVKLAESRSFDQLRGNSRLESSDIRCMNNDGKKAKYRVLNSEEDRNNSDQSQLYFCSKCTIPLVQQGFIVDEIGKDTGREGYRHPDAARFSDYRGRLERKKKDAECLLIEIGQREEEELSRLDNYYSIVFDYLQRQRKTEKRRIEEYYQQKKGVPSAYVQEMAAYVEAIDEVTANPAAKSFRNGELEQVAEGECSLGTVEELGFFEENVQPLVDRFIHVYDENLKLQMGQSVKLSMLQSRGSEVANQSRNEVANQSRNEVASNRNHALRFSFERVITANNGKQMRREAMNPLTEVEEEQCENEGMDAPRQEHTAFRDLFPEEEEVGHLNRDIYSPTFKNI